MPELPEVEIIARTLRGQIIGQVIEKAEIRWAGSIACPTSGEFEQQLIGSEIVSVGRRGKYLILGLKPTGYLLVHLRMTGVLHVCDFSDGEKEESSYDHPHTRVVIHFRSGKMLCFRDQRKFGRMFLVADLQEIAGDLGPEPLADAFTPDMLGNILRSHHRQLKPLLLDQERLAGLGNIYVDEALWEARLHPLRQSDSLDRSIQNRGTTFRDYRDSNNRSGNNQLSLNAYGREGKPCPRCGHEIARIKVAQRSSYFCPVCQPAPDSQPTGGALAHPGH